MANLVFQLKNSADEPLDGYVDITLDSAIVDADFDAHLPAVSRVTLDNLGQATVTIEPSEVVKVAYLFQVYENNLITPEPTDEDPTPDPVNNPILVWSVRAFVPDDPTVYFSDLVNQTSITSDILNSSLSSIARLIAGDANFQSLAQVIFNHKGAWSNITTYRKGDLVLFDGSSYLYVNNVPTEANIPNESNSQYWNLFVSKGDPATGTLGNNSTFGSSWNGSLETPTRNAVYDELVNKLDSSELANTLATTTLSYQSPQMTGSPTCWTPVAGSDNSQVANTSWVRDRIENFVDFNYLDNWTPTNFSNSAVFGRQVTLGTGAELIIDYNDSLTYVGAIKFRHRNASNVQVESTIGRVAGDALGYVNLTGDFRFNTPVHPASDNAFRIGNSSLRWQEVFAVNGTIQTSDARQKKNIAHCDLGLSFIEQLNPVKYNWIFEADNDRPHYGIIAQELEQVLGCRFAGLRVEDGYYSLNYSQLIAPLIKAVQELSNEVKQLKNND